MRKNELAYALARLSVVLLLSASLSIIIQAGLPLSVALLAGGVAAAVLASITLE